MDGAWLFLVLFGSDVGSHNNKVIMVAYAGSSCAACDKVGARREYQIQDVFLPSGFQVQLV